MPMVTPMKESGKTTWHMAMAPSTIAMVPSTVVSGMRTSNKEKEQKLGQTDLNMRVSSKMDSNKARENSNGHRTLCTKVGSFRTMCRGREFIPGVMDEYTMVNG